MPHVDLAFRVMGTTLPVDHGYALYAAINRLLPVLHAAREIGIHPIRGRYVGEGNLHLTPYRRARAGAAERLTRLHPLPGRKRVGVRVPGSVFLCSSEHTLFVVRTHTGKIHLTRILSEVI